MTKALVRDLVSPDKAHYDEVAIHYFTQYHLHLQLLDAVEYAHKNHVIIKATCPLALAGIVLIPGCILSYFI